VTYHGGILFSQSARQGNHTHNFSSTVAPSRSLRHLSATRLLPHMSRIFQDNSPAQDRPVGMRIDRKLCKSSGRRRLPWAQSRPTLRKQRPHPVHVKIKPLETLHFLYFVLCCGICVVLKQRRVHVRLYEISAKRASTRRPNASVSDTSWSVRTKPCTNSWTSSSAPCCCAISIWKTHCARKPRSAVF
jgi:hypothetical protein